MQSFAMPPDENEPVRIDCARLAKAGLWEEKGCCEACHRNVCSDPLALEQDLGPGGETGRTRLQLCCRAGMTVDLAKAFALTSAPTPASR